MIVSHPRLDVRFPSEFFERFFNIARQGAFLRGPPSSDVHETATIQQCIFGQERFN